MIDANAPSEVGDWFLDIEARLLRSREIREQLVGEVNDFVNGNHDLRLVPNLDGSKWDVIMEFDSQPDTCGGASFLGMSFRTFARPSTIWRVTSFARHHQKR